MKIFKIDIQSNNVYKLTVKTFEEVTGKRPPYYQPLNGIMHHYAVCPGCDNPILIIGLYVDRKTEAGNRPVSLHARHNRYDVPGLAQYDEDRYHCCPYSNPLSLSLKDYRPDGAIESNTVLRLLRENIDIVHRFIQEEVGVNLNNPSLARFLTKFSQECGHKYRSVNVVNLPYAFMYLSDSQSIVFQALSIYNSGISLGEEISKKSQYFEVSNGFIAKKKGVKVYAHLDVYFSDHKISKDGDEKTEAMTMNVVESTNADDATNIFTKEIVFEKSKFLNSVAKRARQLALANQILVEN